MTDQPDHRSFELSVEVPGTPEAVWAAIATGPGITSWFVPCRVDEAAGGEAVFDFGAYGKETAAVVAYEPPHRFVGESASGPEPGVATAAEWLIEARDGGTCVVRLVQSGFAAGPEGDAQIDGLREGWQLFFENLKLHLTYFAGEQATAIMPMAMATGANEDAFERLSGALGIAPDLAPGQRFEAKVGTTTLQGEVHHARHAPGVGAYVSRLDGEVRGTALFAAEGRGDTIALSAWLYVYDGDVRTIERDVNELLASAFPPSPQLG